MSPPRRRCRRDRCRASSPGARHRAAGEHDDLVAGQAAAGVGPDGARPEAHRPVGAERQGRHDWPEIAVVGVHADPLAGAVLVDDALHRQRADEALTQPLRHDLGPARERRGRDRAAGAPVVVTVAVMLHPAAELGHPGRRADAQQEAVLLGRGDEVGDDDRLVGEDAVARHALPPHASERPCPRFPRTPARRPTRIRPSTLWPR